MKLYSVHLPRGARLTRDDAETVVLVKEGISWPALFLPLLWQLWHGMWLILLAYLAVAVAAELLLSWLGGDTLAGAGAVLFGILFALEANELRRWHLNRKGYRQVAMVAGRNMEEAEFRFFSLALESPEQTPAATAAPQPLPPRPIPQAPSSRADPLGVFPEPRGRP